MFERLWRAALTATPRKCKFGMDQVLYLEFTIGKGHVKPEETKTKTVNDYTRPQSKTDIRAFLVLVGYYRKFIPNFSRLVAPLSDLAKKSV